MPAIPEAPTAQASFVVVLSDENGEAWFFCVQAADDIAAVQAAFNDLVPAELSAQDRADMAPRIKVDHVFPGRIGTEIVSVETCAHAFGQAV